MEVLNGQFTGKVSGVPAFQHGKVIQLTAWLKEKKLTLEGSWFYGDSHNDRPLFDLVDHPVLVELEGVWQE